MQVQANKKVFLRPRKAFILQAVGFFLYELNTSFSLIPLCVIQQN